MKIDRVRAFMDAHVYPNEQTFADQMRLPAKLRQLARSHTLRQRRTQNSIAFIILRRGEKFLRRAAIAAWHHP